MSKSMWIFAAALFILSSCGTDNVGPEQETPAEPGYPVSVVDASGRTVVIGKKPRRIVSCAPMYTQILIDLGVWDRVVAVATSPNNPSRAEALPAVGDPLRPNLEEIVKLKPDVVFGGFGDTRTRLEKAGISVILCGRNTSAVIDDVEELYRTIRLVGLVVGEAPHAETLVGGIREHIDRVRDTVRHCPRVSAAVLYLARDMPPYIQGKDSLADQILNMVQGQNIFHDVSSQQVSMEQLIQLDPEVIITDPEQIELITGDERLRRLKAVRNHKVYGVKASLWTSSKLHETVETVARYLHPQAF